MRNRIVRVGQRKRRERGRGDYWRSGKLERRRHVVGTLRLTSSASRRVSCESRYGGHL